MCRSANVDIRPEPGYADDVLALAATMGAHIARLQPDADVDVLALRQMRNRAGEFIRCGGLNVAGPSV